MENVEEKMQETPLPETSIAPNVTSSYEDHSHKTEPSTDSSDTSCLEDGHSFPSESSVLASEKYGTTSEALGSDIIPVENHGLEATDTDLETSTSFISLENSTIHDVSVLSGRSKTVAKHAKHLSFDSFVGTVRVHDDTNLLSPRLGSQSSLNSPKSASKTSPNRGLIDTTAPIESVKQAVSMFGGIVDWKAHRAQTVEKRKVIEQELEKTQLEIPSYKNKCKEAEDAKLKVQNELDKTKTLIEELNLNLSKAQTEEQQAKQDAELAALRVEEIKLGITDESSTAAKAQLDVAKSRHEAAISELETVRNELEGLRKGYGLLVIERDEAFEKAEEAVFKSKEAEKILEDLTNELITAKETLESAHSAHLEAEERRLGAAMARELDVLNFEKDLKKVEVEIEGLNRNKSKLDETADESVSSAKQGLEDLKKVLKKETYEVNCLKMAVNSLKSELENEKTEFATIKQREGMASVVVSSLESELDRVKSEIDLVQTKVNEVRHKMVEFPNKLQMAVLEADQAKSVLQTARDDLQKAKDESELVKSGAITIESKLIAAEKEILAAKATEKLAISAINALQESESNESSGVTLSFEEYYKLSKLAYDAEEEANKRIADAISQIELAKQSELINLNKLEELTRETDEKKADLNVAHEKADKAKEGKLGIEQELRKWRADHEQKRKVANSIPKTSSLTSVDRNKKKGPNNLYISSGVSYQELSPRAHSRSNYTEIESSPQVKVTKKKKRSFFPRFFMFLSRRKSQAKNA